MAVNIPKADAQAELERILASKGFASAGRLSRLLRYIVRTRTRWPATRAS